MTDQFMTSQKKERDSTAEAGAAHSGDVEVHTLTQRTCHTADRCRDLDFPWCASWRAPPGCTSGRNSFHTLATRRCIGDRCECSGALRGAGAGGSACRSCPTRRGRASRRQSSTGSSARRFRFRSSRDDLLCPFLDRNRRSFRGGLRGGFRSRRL